LSTVGQNWFCVVLALTLFWCAYSCAAPFISRGVRHSDTISNPQRRTAAILDGARFSDLLSKFSGKTSLFRSCTLTLIAFDRSATQNNPDTAITLDDIRKALAPSATIDIVSAVLSRCGIRAKQDANITRLSPMKNLLAVMFWLNGFATMWSNMCFVGSLLSTHSVFQEAISKRTWQVWRYH
jgi:hypothetical protein